MFHLSSREERYLLSRFESVDKDSAPPRELMEATKDLNRKLSEYVRGGVFIDFQESLKKFNETELEVRRDSSKNWS